MPKDANDELKNLEDFLLKYYPGEVAEETPVQIVIRLLSPTNAGVNDSRNPRVPNWAVDTLAKKELKRLAQYLLNSHVRELGNGTVVDSAIGMIEKAYLPTS